MEILILAILLGLIPAMVAQSKGRSFVPWWIYGSLLFLIALPHALLLKPEIKEVEQQQEAQGFKKCPFCAEMIKPDAKVCRYCGRDLPEAEPPPRPEPSAPPSNTPPNDPSGDSAESFAKVVKVWTPPPWERASPSRLQQISPDDPGVSPSPAPEPLVIGKSRAPSLGFTPTTPTPAPTSDASPEAMVHGPSREIPWDHAKHESTSAATGWGTDPMRVFAWVLIALGAAVIVLTIPLVNAHNEVETKVSLDIANKYGRYREPQYAGYGLGILAGMLLASFGVLVLAIRRPPTKRPVVEERAPGQEPAASPPSSVIAQIPWDDPSRGSISPLAETESFSKAELWTPPPWKQASQNRPQRTPPSDDPREDNGSILTTPEPVSKAESWGPPPPRKRSDADARVEQRRTAGRRSRALALIVILVIAAFALVGTGAYIRGRRAANNALLTAQRRASVPSPTQDTAGTPPATTSRASAPSATQEAAMPTPPAPGASSLSPTQAAPVAPAPSRVLALSPTQKVPRGSADYTPRAVGGQQSSEGCAARLPADQRITLNLKDADIQTTLRLFASAIPGVKIVSTDDVKGTITLEFFSVPVREAFQTIIDKGKLRCVLTGEVLRVSTVAQSKEAAAPATGAPLSRATLSQARPDSATAATRGTTQPTPLPAPQKAMPQSPPPPGTPLPAEYYAGLKAADAKDWLGAERAYRAAIQESPGSSDIWYKLGVALGQQKRVPESIAAYQEAVRLNRDHARGWHNLGLELSRQRDYSGALAAFKEFTRLEPTNARGWTNRGRLHALNKELPEAISAYQEAIRLKPDDAEVLYELGFLQALSKNTPAVAEVRARLQQIDPAKARQLQQELRQAGTTMAPEQDQARTAPPATSTDAPAATSSGR